MTFWYILWMLIYPVIGSILSLISERIRSLCTGTVYFRQRFEVTFQRETCL